MYTEYHSNQYLFISRLSLHSLTVILIFTIFSSFFFKIHYRTEIAVCQNISKTAIQNPAVIVML